jgi:hypothetical protein
MSHIGARRSVLAVTAAILAGWGLAAAAAPAASGAAVLATAHSAAVVRPACATPAGPGKATCQILASAPASTAAPRRGATGPRGAAAAADCAATNSPSGYDPAQLQSAYRLQSATSGSGMVAAVVAPYNDPNAASDLCVYRAQYGLTPCSTANGCLTEVNELGGASLPAANDSWALSISAQLDMISATCPNCRILLVETSTPAITDVGTGVNTAVRLGADVVTLGVAQPEAAADTATYDSEYFDHPGVVITAAAGDNAYGVSYPAASPYVVAVGGTTLTQAGATGCAASARDWCETVWNDTGSPAGGATGSGCSAYEPKPSWQKDTGCTLRTDNDLAADADPDTGVAVYDSYGEGGWQAGTGLGGTSIAAAIMAGAYALDGQSSGSPASYPYSHGTADSISDITAGNDLAPGATCTPAYLCTAAAGYDGPSGLGSPAGTTALSDADGLAGVVYLARPGLCLDNSGGSLVNLNKVDISTCGGAYNSQQWTVEPDGTIHLSTSGGKPPSNWCLDVYHSGTADFTPVDLYTCNGGGAQQWLPQAGGNIINPESGLCLDDPNASDTNGTQLQIRTCGNYLSQEWALPYPTPAAAGEIVAQDTGMCLDNYHSALADRNVIDVYPCNDGPDSQDWTVENDGTVRLPSGYCLDVAYSGLTAGSVVDLFTCNGSDSQQWRELADGALVNPESGLCLTDPGTASTQLEIQACDGAADQSWTLPSPAPPA